MYMFRTAYHHIYMSSLGHGHPLKYSAPPQNGVPCALKTNIIYLVSLPALLPLPHLKSVPRVYSVLPMGLHSNTNKTANVG